MKSHEAARKLVHSHQVLAYIHPIANEHMQKRIEEAQNLIREVCDGLYPHIIEEIRKESIDVTG